MKSNIEEIIKKEKVYSVETAEYSHKIPAKVVDELMQHNIEEGEALELIANLKDRDKDYNDRIGNNYTLIKKVIICVLDELGISIDQLSLVLDQIKNSDLFENTDKDSIDEKVRYIVSLIKEELYNEELSFEEEDDLYEKQKHNVVEIFPKESMGSKYAETYEEHMEKVRRKNGK